jgi:hypothetical protein
MKKEYNKPETVMEIIVCNSMLASSPGNDNVENMGSNETPGGDDDFNAAANRGGWGTLWK